VDAGYKNSCYDACGYHRQVVTGLTEKTEVLISTDKNGGECGVFYVDRNRLRSLNPIARRLFKHEVDMVYLTEYGQVVIGNALPENIKLIQSPLTVPAHYRSVELFGIPALVQAVSRGQLRKATLEDAHSWVDVISEELPPKDTPAIAGEGVVKPRRPMLRNAYVVLKPFTYSGGLLGRNSAIFFIPKGVSMPEGKLGDSIVYGFNALTCLGRYCNR
jgi:hypothetical protein